MRPRESYKLRQEVLGIILEHEPRTTVMIPEGSVITVIAGPLDGARMVDVTWNGKTIMIFARICVNVGNWWTERNRNSVPKPERI